MVSTHEDLKAILKNLKKSWLNEGRCESHWFKDLEYRIYPKRGPLEELESIDAHLAKENKKIYSRQEVSTHRVEVSTH